MDDRRRETAKIVLEYSYLFSSFFTFWVGVIIAVVEGRFGDKISDIAS